jgi:hypothetical protein
MMHHVNRFTYIAVCAVAVGLATDVGAIEPTAPQPAPPPPRRPVTLSYTPRWQPADWNVQPSRPAIQPAIEMSRASDEFVLYELPELGHDLDFDVQAPQRGKPTVGGWIAVGYHSGQLGQ